MQRLSERWGQSFLVDNRTGGGGVLAVTLLAQAPADGYTLYGGGSQVVTATPLKKVPFDTRIVLMPVVQMTSSWYFLLVHPSVPATSVKELIALAKRRPGTLNYGSAGAGSASHLGMELLKFRTDIGAVHIPYKGNGQALIDLVSGQVQMLLTSTISGTSHVKSGRARAIAVSSLKRLAAYPELPTVSESGAPGYELDNMYGIYAPAKVPPPIISALNGAISEIVSSGDMKVRIAADGAEPIPPHRPAQFRERFSKELEMWAKFVTESGIRIE
jgi:tripartite-type tricarboxylate transporter receptor subunit TctC